MVKLSEIAKESGFSIPVVSRVLSPKPHKDARVAEETRKHIQAVAKRMGYRPNRNAEFLKRGQNPVIGCFLPKFRYSLITDLIMGISEEAAKVRFPLSFFFELNAESYHNFLKEAQKSNNCGIITYPYFSMDKNAQKLIDEYHAQDGKMVMISPFSENYDDIVTIQLDNKTGSALAAKRLIQRGCKTFFTYQAGERSFFFQEKLNEYNFSPHISKDPNECLKNIIAALSNGLSEKIGLFCSQDCNAVWLHSMLLQNGIIPGQQVLLISYDNLFLTKHVAPAITTIEQSFIEVGALAMRKLVNIIYGNNESSAKVSPKLIIRDSA